MAPGSWKRDLMVLATVVILCALWAFPVFQADRRAEGKTESAEPIDTWRLFNQGQKLLRNGRFEEAEQVYTTILEHDPNYAPALNDRAWVRLELGRIEPALIDAEKAVDQGMRPDNLHTRGCAYVGAGRLNDALSDFQHSLKMNPGWPPAENAIKVMTQSGVEGEELFQAVMLTGRVSPITNERLELIRMEPFSSTPSPEEGDDDKVIRYRQ